jgi:branched-chain amino acid aminotransferase
MSASAWIWMNGKLVPYDQAKLHVSSTALHFGPVAFEGIRCYAFSDGRTNFFRLSEHIARLRASASALHLEIPFSAAEIARACMQTVLANGHSDAYLRLLAFPGAGALGFGRPGGPAETSVLSFPWQNAHLERSQRRGIRAHVSSVIRTEAHRVMSKSKISANYAAGLLAIHQAREAGCDDAFLLDASGAVAEASTANVFAVLAGRIATPPAHLPILPGITRDALLVLSRELGIDAAERTFDARELASADEIFIVGTTAELTPVREVDGRKIGDGVPGPLTAKLLSALQGAVRGEGPDRGWTHPLEGTDHAAALA